MKRVEAEDEDEDAEEESDEEPPSSAITTYTKAVKLGNDMLTFFQSRGEEELGDSMFTIISLTYSLICIFSVINHLTHQHLSSHHDPLHFEMPHSVALQCDS